MKKLMIDDVNSGTGRVLAHSQRSLTCLAATPSLKKEPTTQHAEEGTTTTKKQIETGPSSPPKFFRKVLIF